MNLLYQALRPDSSRNAWRLEGSAGVRTASAAQEKKPLRRGGIGGSSGSLWGTRFDGGGKNHHKSELSPPLCLFATAWVLSPAVYRRPLTRHAYPVQWTVHLREEFRGNGSESPEQRPGFYLVQKHPFDSPRSPQSPIGRRQAVPNTLKAAISLVRQAPLLARLKLPPSVAADASSQPLTK